MGRLSPLLIFISLVCLGLQFEPLASFSIWYRPEIEQGQWWRILTGNLTHTNFAHLGMNMAGLWVITWLFKPHRNDLIKVILLAALFVGMGNLFTPATSYAGLSGILHGIFGYCALKEVFHGRKSSLLLVFGLIGKLAWEHFVGASESTAAMIGARVAVEAHLYGAVGGLLMALIERVLKRR
ncbi:rhombosortase [Vibrio sonorensis]|uniref:rhombosortase n=1 Tax=Vibrio sonorensis TaxID=1004316 RepID=UPI0008D9E4FC|nr:rhombosortase [Vibrio sonorensis]